MFLYLKSEIAEFLCYSYLSPHLTFVTTFDLSTLHIALHSFEGMKTSLVEIYLSL
jgi:predicted MFS family arabinose efflux permease